MTIASAFNGPNVLPDDVQLQIKLDYIQNYTLNKRQTQHIMQQLLIRYVSSF
jgi:hypothetical protein